MEKKKRGAEGGIVFLDDLAGPKGPGWYVYRWPGYGATDYTAGPFVTEREAQDEDIRQTHVVSR